MINDYWTLLVTQGWGAAMLKGAGMTLLISAIGMLAGLLIAFPCALIRWGRVPVLSQLVDVYSVVLRSVPSLLVIYLIFFGSIQTVEAILGFFGYVNSGGGGIEFTMGCSAIALIASAYSIEVLRGALASIDAGVMEAARALALPRRIVRRKIVAPLTLRAALGGLNNIWQLTLKDTSLVSVVGLQEVMRVAAIAAGLTRSALFFYVVAALLYLVITGVSQFLFRRVERRLQLAFAGSRQ